MGPENSSGPFVAYIDGVGVAVNKELPEITLDYSADGVPMADAAEGLAALSAAMANVTVTIEVAAEGIQEFFRAIELATAVHFARVLEPTMVHRYRHTKKKRTRKKYEKRIRAWFREVFR